MRTSSITGSRTVRAGLWAMMIAVGLLCVSLPAAAGDRGHGRGHDWGHDRGHDWRPRHHNHGWQESWRPAPAPHAYYAYPRPPAIYLPPPVVYGPPPWAYAPPPPPPPAGFGLFVPFR